MSIALENNTTNRKQSLDNLEILSKYFKILRIQFILKLKKTILFSKCFS